LGRKNGTRRGEAKADPKVAAILHCSGGKRQLRIIMDNPHRVSLNDCVSSPLARRHALARDLNRNCELFAKLCLRAR